MQTKYSNNLILDTRINKIKLSDLYLKQSDITFLSDKYKKAGLMGHEITERISEHKRSWEQYIEEAKERNRNKKLSQKELRYIQQHFYEGLSQYSK